MQWWLGEYLEEKKIDEKAFLKVYTGISNADDRYIKEFLWVDKEKLDADALLEKINKSTRQKMFGHIANAINTLSESPDSDLQILTTEVQHFHNAWQERMRSTWGKPAQYQKEVLQRLKLLKEDGFPLQKLMVTNAETNPIEAYASHLGELLLSPTENGSDLINEIERLLGTAEPQHMECIVELTTLIAFHFVPTDLLQSEQVNGVTVGADTPAPAIYRLIQSWRNNYVSQLCEYDGRDGGVKGAIPIIRTNLASDDFVMDIAERLKYGIDEQYIASAGADGYEIKKETYTPRELSQIDTQLDMESKSANSRFVYSMETGVLDDQSVELLEQCLPSLNHYSHQPEKDELIPEVVKLDSFLKTAGRKIDERLRSFEADDKPLHDFARLIADALEASGQTAKMASAPKPVDRVKYLKWLNELLKTDKAVRDALGRYPGFAEKASEILSSVKQLSTSSFQNISTLIESVKGLFS